MLRQATPLLAFLRAAPPAPNPTRNPDSQDIARAVLQAKPSSLSQMTATEARGVYLAWFRGRGLEVDRYGNFLVDALTRYKLAPRVVHYQRKLSGEWQSRTSTPYLEGALALLQEAATSLGDAGTLAEIVAVRGRRDTAKKKRLDVDAAAALRRRAREFALKSAAADDPEGAAAWVRALTKSATLGLAESALSGDGRALNLQYLGGSSTERFRSLVASAWTRYLTQFSTGTSGAAGPSDRVFVSAATPPVLPLGLPRIRYTWNEIVDGVPYTVQVVGQDKGASVQIGVSKSGLTINPITLATEVDDGQSVGDAYVSGRLELRDDGAVLAHLVMIESHARRSGAGTRAMTVWCRLMAGYKVRAFVIEAVGPEGMAFFGTLASRGALEVQPVARTRNLLARCAAEPIEGQVDLPSFDRGQFKRVAPSPE